MNPSPKQQPGEAYRTNKRFGIDDVEFADKLWKESGLKEICEKELKSGVRGKVAKGLNSNIRVYEYEKGAEFGREFTEVKSLARIYSSCHHSTLRR